MDFRTQLLSIVMGVATVYALGYGVILFFSAALDKLNSISSDLGKALIAGGIALVGTVITLVVGKIWEQKLKIRQDIRDKKIPFYEHQISTFFEVMFSHKKRTGSKSSEDLEKAFAEFTEKLLVWGSSEVIQAWQEFRSHDWQRTTPIAGLQKLESFVKVLRIDIGNENKNLKDGDLLRLFINDYDASLASSQIPAPSEITGE